MTREEEIEELDESWSQLVSDHNWEVGRLIEQWCRLTCREPDEFATEMGGITSSHAKKLIRVQRKFRGSYKRFKHLHWKHFFVVLNCDDPKHWLGLANKHRWTVDELRNALYTGDKG